MRAMIERGMPTAKDGVEMPQRSRRTFQLPVIVALNVTVFERKVRINNGTPVTSFRWNVRSAAAVSTPKSVCPKGE